ncbi:MAG: hypothetical protein WHS46_13300 [Desulfosoma sp.]
MRKLFWTLVVLLSVAVSQPAMGKWEGLPQSIYDYPILDSPSGKKWIPARYIYKVAKDAGLSTDEAGEYYEFIANQDRSIITEIVTPYPNRPYHPVNNPDPYCRSGIDPNYKMSVPGICVPYITHLDFGFVYGHRNELLVYGDGRRPWPELYGDYRLFRDEYRIHVGAVVDEATRRRVFGQAMDHVKELVAYYNVQSYLGTAVLVDDPGQANVEVWIVPPRWEEINRFAMERFGISIPDENHLPQGSFAYRTSWISSEPGHSNTKEHVLAFGFYHEPTGKSVGMVFSQPWVDGAFLYHLTAALLGGFTGDLKYLYQVTDAKAITFSAAARLAGCNAWDAQCVGEKARPLFELRAAYVGDACRTYIDYGQMPGFDQPVLHMTVAMPDFSSPMATPEETALWYDVQAVIELDPFETVMGGSFFYRVTSAVPVEPKECVPVFFMGSRREWSGGYDGFLEFPALHYGNLDNWSDWLGPHGNHADRWWVGGVRFVDGQILF